MTKLTYVLMTHRLLVIKSQENAFPYILLLLRMLRTYYPGLLYSFMRMDTIFVFIAINTISINITIIMFAKVLL